MPRKSKRRKKPAVEHTEIAVRIERYDVHAAACINRDAYEPQYAIATDERDPVYEFKTALTIYGKSTWPKERAGDAYEFRVYGDDSPSRRLDVTLKDAQVRDSRGMPQYREYRGKQIPVYGPPRGIGMVNKVWGEPRWEGWAFVAPRFVQDVLAVLNQTRPLYVSLHERKEDRARWVQGLTVQTIDPEIEE